MMRRRGVFVTGTDTGVGKTFVAACLVRRWSAEYWKPAQTGLAEDPGDSATVATLAGAAAHRIHPPRHEFAAPLSPEAAAGREGRSIAIGDFTLPGGEAPLVVEGAGGVLVPIGGGASMAELMQSLGLPVLLVARGTLGTINHSLLSLEALRRRELDIFGVVVVGEAPDGNAETIARLGQVAVLAILPRMAALDPHSVAWAAALLPALPPRSRRGIDQPERVAGDR